MKKIFNIKNILIFSFIAKLVYVFAFTDYQKYLFSDCAGYWFRAMERFSGKDVVFSQWAVWPIFPHIVLSWVFRALWFLGVFNYKHQIIIIINVILSTGCVWFLYHITQELTAKKGVALIVSFTYAFSFPFFYYNAFILSEHPAFFTCLFSLYLVICRRYSLFWILMSGVILGVSVAFRPANALVALPFFSYILFESKKKSVLDKTDFKWRFVKSFLFSVGFFLVVIGLVLENYRVSKGELKSISANGGMNFYFEQCHTHQVISRYNGYTYTFTPPRVSNYKQGGVLETTEPFHNQAYFYKMGFECFKKSWYENLFWARNIYFSPIFPGAKTYGSFFWMEAFRYILLVMSFSTFLIFALLRIKSYNKTILWFLFTIPIVHMVMMYFYNFEFRYLFAYAFVFYIFFFCVLFEIVTRMIRMVTKFLVLPEA